MKELAFRTPSIVGCFRQFGCQQLRPNLKNNFLYLTTERRCEIDFDPVARSAVPHMAMSYYYIEHLFKTERLRAQLKVSRSAMTDTRFVFDRNHRSVVHFDCVGAT